MMMRPSATAPITGNVQSVPPEVGAVRPVTTTFGSTGLASGVSCTGTAGDTVVVVSGFTVRPSPLACATGARMAAETTRTAAVETRCLMRNTGISSSDDQDA